MAKKDLVGFLVQLYGDPRAEKDFKRDRKRYLAGRRLSERERSFLIDGDVEGLRRYLGAATDTVNIVDQSLVEIVDSALAEIVDTALAEIVDSALAKRATAERPAKKSAKSAKKKAKTTAQRAKPGKKSPRKK